LLRRDLAISVFGASDTGGVDQTIRIPGCRYSGTPPTAGVDRVTDKPKKTSPSAQQKKSVTRLGDFELQRRLGKGGMGEVFLARQISLDRMVAVKTLTKELAKQEDFVKRFQREARAMAKIDHHNVVKVYAVASYKGVHFVAIEYIDGKSVQDWLDELGQLSIADAVHIAVVCAEALRHAHSKNMVHRDVKPDNILLNSKGVVKVADFGLAKVMDEDVSMTQSGQGLGTPLYMAPEQARSAKHVDQRCDIYALGATLYHLLTGQLPYAGDSTLELIIAKEKGIYTSAKKLRPEIPERLDLIIDKMMATDPSHRYKTSEEALRDLSGLGLHGQPLSFIEGAEPPAGGARSQAPTMAAMGATLAGGAGGLTMLPSSDAQNTTSNRTWYVQYRTPDDKPMMEKFSSRRVVKMINAGMLTPKARAKASSDGSYLPLAQFPEFVDAIDRQLARKAATGKNEDMQSLYKQVDRDERSRLRWRWLQNRIRGLVGGVGLIVWIIAISILGVVLFWGVETVWDWLGETFNEMMQEGASDQKDPLNNIDADSD
jgi:serine/threonine protein kinase